MILLIVSRCSNLCNGVAAVTSGDGFSMHKAMFGLVRTLFAKASRIQDCAERS